MTKKQKRMLARIIVSAVIFIPLFVLEHTGVMDLLPHRWISLLIFLVPYGIIGWDILKKTGVNLVHGQIFDENLLMTVATFGAFGVGEYSEGVAVMLLYQIGELFQSVAVGRSRQSISDMMDIAPEYANLETDDGLEEADPEDVPAGSVIIIKPGERVPLDGVVIEGESMLDTSALTGESVPRSIRAGEEIYSGCVNGSGTLRVRTVKEYSDSTVARILELVENASEKKAKAENFITRFAKYYTPIVTVCALLLAVIPPLLCTAGLFVYRAPGSIWADCIKRACTFLVISCPCALVISVPMGFFGGIGAASKLGVLVKGSNYLEALSEINTIIFDKTGTLTKGQFKVTDIISCGMDENELLRITAHAEGYSNHPIALSIIEAYRERTGISPDMSVVSGNEEIAGCGICTSVDGRKIYAGNEKLMDKAGVPVAELGIDDRAGTIVYVAEDKALLGAVVISDAVKEGAAKALSEMKRVGIAKTVMLTGDNEKTAGAVAKELSIDEYYAGLLPGDKVAKVEELLEVKNAGSKNKSRVAFVGDGINDAPVLRRADVGIAMGTMGSDAAIEAADVVIMDDDIRKIALIVSSARRTLRIVHQNIVFALAVKFLVLLLGFLGLASMWAAVFADVGVCVIAVANSMRALCSEKS